jgi:hypothetical protein
VIGVAVLAALALPVLAGPKPTLGLQARAELRLREPGDPPPGGDITKTEKVSADYELTTGATLDLKLRRWSFSLGYSPRYTGQNFNHDVTHELLHTGNLAIGYRFKRVTLTLSEIVTYGDRSYYSLLVPTTRGEAPAGEAPVPGPAAPTPGAGAPVPPTGPADIQAVPQNTRIRYFGSTTSLVSTATLSPRSTLGLGAGYTIGGGADDESRATLPMAAGPFGFATWTYNLRHGNQLTTQAQGTATETRPAVPPRIRTTLIAAQEIWARQWARRTTSTLGIGASVNRTKPGDGRWRPAPDAFATLSHGIITGPRGALLTLGAGVSDASVLDQLTGRADNRVTVTGSVTWNYRKLLLYANANRTQSPDASEENAVVLTAGDFGARQQLGQMFALEAGVRLFHQSIQNQTTPAAQLAYDGITWTEFVALTFTPKGLRF